jgi:hypothetical protein
VQDRIARVDGERVLIARQRFVMAAHCIQRHPKIDVQIHIIRVDGVCGSSMAGALGSVLWHRLQVRLIAQGIEIGLFLGDRQLEGIQCLVHSPQLFQDDAAIVDGLGKIGPYRDSLVIAGEPFSNSPFWTSSLPALWWASAFPGCATRTRS